MHVLEEARSPEFPDEGQKPLFIQSDWSDTNGANKPGFAVNRSGAMAWDMGWTDQVVYKFGAQVRPIQNLALRAGYNYGKMPLDPNCAFENLAFPAVSEHHFSAGAGYDFGR